MLVWLRSAVEASGERGAYAQQVEESEQAVLAGVLQSIAEAKGRLKGRAPKLSPPRQAHLVKLHAAGEHTIVELAELFEVSRPTVYRVLERACAPKAAAGAA